MEPAPVTQASQSPPTATVERIHDSAAPTKSTPNQKVQLPKYGLLRNAITSAASTGFGYTRIIGELRKLGIKRISRQTVRNILKEEGIQPAPDRTSDKWDNFIKRHAETLWAVDFFSVKTITTRGLRDMYVMVWLCMTSREVIVSDATEHPNSAWVVKQADLFVDQTANREKKPDIIMHDRDYQVLQGLHGRG